MVAKTIPGGIHQVRQALPVLPLPVPCGAPAILLPHEMLKCILKILDKTE